MKLRSSINFGSLFLFLTILGRDLGGIRSSSQDDTDGTSSIVLPCPGS